MRYWLEIKVYGSNRSSGKESEKTRGTGRRKQRVNEWCKGINANGGFCDKINYTFEQTFGGIKDV